MSLRATNFVKWLTIHRIRDIPSRIAFEFTQFPNNVPLPSHQTSARILGGLLHFLHLCVRVSQGRAVPDSELGWEDMYAEDTGASWFSWTVPLTLLLQPNPWKSNHLLIPSTYLWRKWTLTSRYLRQVKQGLARLEKLSSTSILELNPVE